MTLEKEFAEFMAGSLQKEFAEFMADSLQKEGELVTSLMNQCLKYGHDLEGNIFTDTQLSQISDRINRTTESLESLSEVREE